MNEDQTKGKAKQAEGTVQESWGDAKEKSDDALDQAKDKSGTAWDELKQQTGNAWGSAKEKIEDLRGTDDRPDNPEHERSGGDAA